MRTWKHTRLGLAPTVLLLSLASCTVGPDYRSAEQPSPATWTSSQAGRVRTSEVPTDWWRLFGDPQLTKHIKASARSNKDLAQAAARVREARALRQVAASTMFPNIGARANVLKETISENGRIPAGVIPEIPRRRNVYEGGFDAYWELDVFGGNRRRIEAADARVAGVEETERSIRLSVLAETARNYLELRGSQRQLGIVEKNIGLQQRTLDLSKQKLSVGTGTEIEVARAEAQIRTTESRLPNLNAEIAAAAYRLSILTGQQPGALLGDLLKRKPLPAPPDIVPVGLPSGLLRRRPDVRRVERELAAATADIGVATADLFPRFSLTGAAGTESLKFGDLFMSGSQVALLGPQIHWPIFQGGQIRANIKATEARAEAAAAAFEQAVLTSLAETESALERYGRELETRRRLEAAAAAHRSAVDLSQQRLEAGSGTLFEVIDAEARLLSVESDLVQSETTVMLNLTALYKALGGGWEL